MKTLLGTFLALGLFSTAASAQYCPPGYGYGQRVTYGHTFHRPTHTVMPKVIVEMPAPTVDARPIEPAPIQPEPAPEAAPPK